MTLAIDVAWVPAELSSRGGETVVVIDAVRATTSITTALAAGANRVIPQAGVAEARAARDARGDGGLLCGEAGGIAPPGFDLDNSPRSFTRDAVEGRTLFFATTNGTPAMRRAVGATRVILGCFRNLAAVARRVADAACDPDANVVVVCAGREGRVSMDDAWCAGHLVRRLTEVRPEADLTDGARAAATLSAGLGPPTGAGLAVTAAGRALVELGLGGDLDVCARLDDLELVPVWSDAAFVTGGGGGDLDVG